MPIISEFYGITVRMFYNDHAPLRGKCIIVDFKPIIEKGGVFSILADPQVFSKVQLGNRGRYIAWGEIDFCADSFRLGSLLE